MEDDPWADVPASPRPPSIHDSSAKPGPSPGGSKLAQPERPSFTSSSAPPSPSSSPPLADNSPPTQTPALDISFESTAPSTSNSTDQPSQQDASSPGLGGQKSAAAGLESHEQSEQSSAQDGQSVEKPKPLSETPAIRDLPVDPNSEAQADTSAPAEEGFPASSASEEPTPIEGGDDFDDFDDFDDPQDSTTAAATAGPSSSFAGDGFVSAPAASRAGGGLGDDDGFGDFGDFEEGDFEEPAAIATDTGGTFPQAGTAPEPERWSALNLRPFPPKSELLQQVTDLLAPLQDSNAGFGQASGSGSNSNLNPSLTDEPVRMVGGLSQIMVAESSRDVYAQLTTAPILKPLDWTRSRVRRDHLISMGVPVNLDEVDSHRISALPPLRITTGDAPPPPRRSTAQEVSRPQRSGSLDSTRKGKGKERETDRMGANSPGVNGHGHGEQGRNGHGKYGLGEKPEFDLSKAEELCGLEEDRLSILSLASIKRLQEELVHTSSQASALLAWQLQMKDAQAQDSATYNGMISELIANATKAKSAQQTGSGGGGVFRRSSQRVSSVPSGAGRGIGSGNSTPRVGSPAIR